MREQLYKLFNGLVALMPRLILRRMPPVHLLWRDHREALRNLVDAEGRPAAFWIRKAGKDN